MKRALWLILAICLLLPLAARAADSVNALGRAPLGKNENQARTEAVGNALKQAVGQAALGMLDAATLRSSLKVLDEKIVKQAQQFVGSYTIEATATDASTVLALVSVSLDRAALEKALALAGLRVPVGHLGTVMVLVAEEAAPGRPPVYWWSGYGQPDGAPAAMAAVMKAMGIKIAEPGPLRQNLPPELMNLNLTPEQAVSLARLAGADIVISGRMRGYPLVNEKGAATPPLAEMVAYEVNSGRALAQVVEQGPVFNEPPGLDGAQQVQAALEEAVRSLVAQLAASRPITAAENEDIGLELRGVNSIGQLLKFEQVVTSLTSMVQSMERRSVGGGKATYAMKISVSPSRLADELLVQNFGSFLINVADVAPGEIKLVLLPRR